MANDLIVRAPPPSDHLHPLVYVAIVGLVLLFTGSAFVAFSDNGDAGYLLAVVTGFFTVAVAIPYLLWRIWLKHTGAKPGAEESLHDWAVAECDTWQSRLKGRDAAIQTLLPIAAVAFGMTAIGAVLLLVAHHVV